MTPGALIDSRRFEDAVVQRLDNDSCSLELRASGAAQAGRWRAGCNRESTALRGCGRR
jgi:hypothetical protein